MTTRLLYVLSSSSLFLASATQSPTADGFHLHRGGRQTENTLPEEFRSFPGTDHPRLGLLPFWEDHLLA